MLTFGAPHMGVSAAPHCFYGIICDVINTVINKFIYFKVVQDYIGPAGYFKDTKNYEEYLSYSVFLPYINNEKRDDFSDIASQRFA